MVIGPPLTSADAKGVAMSGDLPLMAVSFASLVGALLGCVTGLLPGLHSNNMAAFVGGNPGLLLAAATLGSLAVGGEGWALVASAAVVACALAHTVANIVPSVFLAVPDEDTALSVLPGHRMAMAGRGREALHVSVASSLAALSLAVVLVVPLRLLMGPPGDLYEWLGPWIGPILLAISSLMVLKEVWKAGGPGCSAGRVSGFEATVVLLAAGVLGHLTLFGAGLVAPLFIGLFGIPTVVIALVGTDSARAPDQVGDRRCSKNLPWTAILRGAMAGTLVGWFPGVSSAQATTMVATGNASGGDAEEEGARRYIAGVSAVNTANAVFTMVALAVLLRVRSGAASAVDGLMAWHRAPWGEGALPSFEVAVLLMAAMVGGLVAAPVTLWVGTRIGRFLHHLSHRWTLRGLLLLLVGVPTVVEGWEGLLVVSTAAALGMVPPILGLMRVHLMGAVSLPLALALIVVG